VSNSSAIGIAPDASVVVRQRQLSELHCASQPDRQRWQRVESAPVRESFGERLHLALCAHCRHRRFRKRSTHLSTSLMSIKNAIFFRADFYDSRLRTRGRAKVNRRTSCQTNLEADIAAVLPDAYSRLFASPCWRYRRNGQEGVQQIRLRGREARVMEPAVRSRNWRLGPRPERQCVKSCLRP